MVKPASAETPRGRPPPGSACEAAAAYRRDRSGGQGLRSRRRRRARALVADVGRARVARFQVAPRGGVGSRPVGVAPIATGVPAFQSDGLLYTPGAADFLAITLQLALGVGVGRRLDQADERFQLGALP